MAAALISGSAWIFTQLSNKVDGLESKVAEQSVTLAGVAKDMQFLQAENSKLNKGLEELQDDNAELTKQVWILEQKK